MVTLRGEGRRGRGSQKETNNVTERTNRCTIFTRGNRKPMSGWIVHPDIWMDQILVPDNIWNLEPISKPISGFRFPPVKMVHRLDRSSVTVKKERGRDPHGEPAGNGGHEEIDDENNLKMK